MLDQQPTRMISARGWSSAYSLALPPPNFPLPKPSLVARPTVSLVRECSEGQAVPALGELLIGIHVHLLLELAHNTLVGAR